MISNPVAVGNRIGAFKINLPVKIDIIHFGWLFNLSR